MPIRPEVLLEAVPLTNGEAVRVSGFSPSGLLFRTGSVLGINYARALVLDNRNRTYSVRWALQHHSTGEISPPPDDIGIWHQMSRSEICDFENSRSAILVTGQSRMPIADWIAFHVDGRTFLIGLCRTRRRTEWFTSRVSYIDPGLGFAITYPDGCLHILLQPALRSEHSVLYEKALLSWLVDPLVPGRALKQDDVHSLFCHRSVWPPEHLRDVV